VSELRASTKRIKQTWGAWRRRGNRKTQVTHHTKEQSAIFASKDKGLVSLLATIHSFCYISSYLRTAFSSREPAFMVNHSMIKCESFYLMLIVLFDMRTTLVAGKMLRKRGKIQ